jgi:hypothetical protein
MIGINEPSNCKGTSCFVQNTFRITNMFCYAEEVYTILLYGHKLRFPTL